MRERRYRRRHLLRPAHPAQGDAPLHRGAESKVVAQPLQRVQLLAGDRHDQAQLVALLAAEDVGEPEVAEGVLGVAAVAGATWILWPNGEYKPIQPGERWTLAESVQAASEISSGRPSLSEARETELGGVSSIEDQVTAVEVRTL